jgi:hypothetical protein
MRKAKGISIAAVFSGVVSTMAFASPPNVSDGQLVDSMQAVQLIPNTPTYAMWANWIRTQIAHDTANYHDFRNGRFVAKAISTDVDLITIRTAIHTTSSGSSSSLHSHASLDGNTASLPINGQSGEHITIVSQTTTTYLSWTYIWNTVADDGHGGWQLTGSAFHDCQYLHEPPQDIRCQRN